MNPCYRCKRKLSAWNTWLFCKSCGFSIELSNALHNTTISEKKIIFDLLSQELPNDITPRREARV